MFPSPNVASILYTVNNTAVIPDSIVVSQQPVLESTSALFHDVNVFKCRNPGFADDLLPNVRNPQNICLQ